MDPCVVIQPVPANAEDARTLARQHLASEELALLSPRAAPKRVAEFVAGRVAARRAVARLLRREEPNASFLILREGDGPTGCPKVVSAACSSASPVHVSISHADGLAVAAAAHGRIGIDLATVQEQAPSFLDETFGIRELEQWGTWLKSDPGSPLTVTTAFAAKEAALKWLGTGFGMALRGIEVVPSRGNHRQWSQSADVEQIFDLKLTQHGRGCDVPTAHYRPSSTTVALIVL